MNFNQLSDEQIEYIKKTYNEKSFEQAMDEMSDEDYWETLQYLRGKIKPN